MPRQRQHGSVRSAVYPRVAVETHRSRHEIVRFTLLQSHVPERSVGWRWRWRWRRPPKATVRPNDDVHVHVHVQCSAAQCKCKCGTVLYEYWIFNRLLDYGNYCCVHCAGYNNHSTMTVFQIAPRDDFLVSVYFTPPSLIAILFYPLYPPSPWPA